jgi:hypothetical protein
VFLGINNQGKMILHEIGQNYKLDFCVDEKEFQALVAIEETQHHISKHQQQRESQNNMPIGIKTTNANSFISSLLPILHEIPEFANLMKGVTISVGCENINPNPVGKSKAVITKPQTDGSLVSADK